jgi:hypothetical protein
MNKFIAGGVMLVCCAVSTPIGADQLKTDFRVTATMNGVNYDEPVPTPPNQTWILPMGFSDWTCKVTPPQINSYSGKFISYGINCVQGSTGLMVGTPVVCFSQKEDYDSSRFFISLGTGTVMIITGECYTHGASTPKSTVPHQL